MNIYANRRKALAEKMEDNTFAFVFSGLAINKSEDEAFPFDVDRSFYYLTGIEKEGMVLCLNKTNGILRESMYILPYDEYLAKWVGGRMKDDEVREISGVNVVNDIADLDDYVTAAFSNLRSSRNLRIYVDLWRYTKEQADSEAIKFAKRIKERHLNTEILDIYPLVASLRMIKDEYEISCIREAIETTRLGIRAMMRNVRPGMNEMVAEGLFNFTLMQRLCNKNAFKTIAASGMRATTLHYSDNNQVMEDGELLLCDLGATYKNYCADISRTFPVNGKFTDRQREIYNIVLSAQKLVGETARPGLTLRDLNQTVIDYYREELPKHGLLKDVSEYYFHGVSHQLGLDTHDVGSRTDVLAPGMVISNEPGLYISDEGIGIRIEDDLLITEDGCEFLSKDIIKNPEDIEALMNRN